jgi:hypothetical protein
LKYRKEVPTENVCFIMHLQVKWQTQCNIIADWLKLYKLASLNGYVLTYGAITYISL